MIELPWHPLQSSRVFFCIRIMTLLLPTFCLRRCSVRLGPALVSWSAYARLRLTLNARYCLRVLHLVLFVLSFNESLIAERKGRKNTGGKKLSEPARCLREASAKNRVQILMFSCLVCLSVSLLAYLCTLLPFLPFHQHPWNAYSSLRTPPKRLRQHWQDIVYLRRRGRKRGQVALLNFPCINSTLEWDSRWNKAGEGMCAELRL